jgi:hypothetical protein
MANRPSLLQGELASKRRSSLLSRPRPCLGSTPTLPTPAMFPGEPLLMLLLWLLELVLWLLMMLLWLLELVLWLLMMLLWLLELVLRLLMLVVWLLELALWLLMLLLWLLELVLLESTAQHCFHCAAGVLLAHDACLLSPNDHVPPPLPPGTLHSWPSRGACHQRRLRAHQQRQAHRLLRCW